MLCKKLIKEFNQLSWVHSSKFFNDKNSSVVTKFCLKMLVFNIVMFKMLEQNDRVRAAGVNILIPSFNPHSSTN